MDIAAFKVSHSVGIDMDATALPAARARSVSIGAEEGMFKMQSPTPLYCAHTTHTINSVGQWRKCIGKGRRRAHIFCGV